MLLVVVAAGARCNAGACALLARSRCVTDRPLLLLPALPLHPHTTARIHAQTHQSPHHSDVKAKVEKRNPYSRHYAFKGRGRKEHLRADVKMDRSELTPVRSK